MLSPRKAATEVDKEREKRGVMVMPQLMEMSCQGRGARGPEGLDCGCTNDTQALAPVFRSAAAFRSGETQHVQPCFSAVRVEYFNVKGIRDGSLLCHNTDESHIC